MSEPKNGDLVVLATGPRVLIEDLGRPGYAALGISGSGAMDRSALRFANRLVGNAEGAAGLEVLLGGLRLRARRSLTIAITGAAVSARIEAEGSPARPVPLFEAARLYAGEVLLLDPPASGLRSYLAVRGGLLGQPLLGSLSSDPTTGLGPAPIEAGNVLRVGRAPEQGVPNSWSADAYTRTGETVLRAVWGPRDDWFTEEARTLFATARWEVTAEADRVGVRLAGSLLVRAIQDELPSEGLVRGSVQVPTNGLPLVFVADHPTTGGYPVIAVVLDADVDLLAQAGPGTGVRFELRRAPWLG